LVSRRWTRLGRVNAMKDATKSKMNTGRWLETAPVLVVAVWVSLLACFFYTLVRAGLPGQ